MSYPYRTDAQQAALERLPATPYSKDDMPFLATQRYQLSPNYDPSDVVAKEQVDLHGCLDNQYWYAQWKENQCQG
jgi:hypothetical protein